MELLFTTLPRRGFVHGAEGPGNNRSFPSIIRHLFVFVLFLTVIGSGSALFGQLRNHYRFQLQDVNDGAAAKMVTDILRPVFNTEAEPYAVFPAFNDELDEFDFQSDVLVTREQLQAVLAPHGIVLGEFSINGPLTPKSEEQ